MTNRPSLLILSFSKLASDARILKQVRAFSSDYDVTTCGFGPPPIEGVEHIEVSASGTPPIGVRRSQAVLLRVRAYRAVYWFHPHLREARRKLRGRHFDAVLANDIDAARIALGVADGDRIHLDLHEFWPGIHDDVEAWRTLRAPYYEWQVATWGRRVNSATTVNRSIADRYEADFGVSCGVVTNSAEFRDLRATEPGEPLRLVHSGGANHNRKIEQMMRAVAESSSGATLDLYLVGEGTDYYRGLVELADQLGERISVLPPVPHAELLQTLNAYDMGIHLLPPSSTNHQMALPNKIFDYVQARLAVLTGPTPPMTEIVEEYDVGVVLEDFTEAALTRAVDALDPEDVARWKSNADAAARPLSAEVQNIGWLTPIELIVRRDRKPI